jgi:hypothetical protein
MSKKPVQVEAPVVTRKSYLDRVDVSKKVTLEVPGQYVEKVQSFVHICHMKDAKRIIRQERQAYRNAQTITRAAKIVQSNESVKEKAAKILPASVMASLLAPVAAKA